MLMTGMSISGKTSVGIFSSTNGVASTISSAITMNVYGRRRASWTIDMGGDSARGDRPWIIFTTGRPLRRSRPGPRMRGRPAAVRDRRRSGAEPSERGRGFEVAQVAAARLGAEHPDQAEREHDRDQDQQRSDRQR